MSLNLCRYYEDIRQAKTLERIHISNFILNLFDHFLFCSKKCLTGTLFDQIYSEEEFFKASIMTESLWMTRRAMSHITAPPVSRFFQGSILITSD